MGQKKTEGWGDSSAGSSNSPDDNENDGNFDHYPIVGMVGRVWIQDEVLKVESALFADGLGQRWNSRRIGNGT